MVRYGKAFRMRGIGYETFNIYPAGEEPSPDVVRFWEIVNKMPPEDAAVIGRIVDSDWYEQNAKDIEVLSSIKD